MTLQISSFPLCTTSEIMDMMDLILIIRLCSVTQSTSRKGDYLDGPDLITWALKKKKKKVEFFWLLTEGVVRDFWGTKKIFHTIADLEGPMWQGMWEASQKW